jgi:hypothetical protein
MIKGGISWHMSEHDRSTFELVVDYQLEGSDEKKAKDFRSKNFFKPQNRTDYSAKMYCFFPKNLQVNQDTIRAQKIYQQGKHYMRLHAPRPKKKEGYILPITRRYLANVSRVLEAKKLNLSLEHEQKLFAHYISHLVKEADHNYKHTRDPQKKAQILKVSVEKLFSLVGEFRKISFSHKGGTRFLFDREKTANLIDEHISGQFMFFLEECLERTNDEQYKTMLANERSYHAFRFGSHRLSRSDREAFYQRVSMLKKFVSSALYLDRINKRRDKMYANMGAALAAGIAAFYTNLIYLKSNLAAGTQDFGFQAYLMILAAVLVYVSKDRMKDMGREYFDKKLRSFLPSSESIFSHKSPRTNGSVFERKILRSVENICFLSNEAVPDDIKYMRKLILNEGAGSELTESVYCHEKEMEILPGAKFAVNSGFLQVKDILRFNIDFLVSGLDNPTRELLTLDESNKLSTILVPKNYFFDVVIKFGDFIKNNKKSKNLCEIVCFRVKFNKQGLLGVERLLDKHSFKYEELS